METKSMAKDDLCLITGVSGYLASWIAKILIEGGYRVRGTMRDLKDKQKILHLKELLPGIEIVEANLNSKTDWIKAMNSVKWVFHTASPQAISSQKENKTKISLEGVTNVFKAALNSSTVLKIVMTSSEGAICFGHPATKTSFSELDWTIPYKIGDYYKSKTFAEKFAWDLIDNKEINKRGIPLSVINPAIILGPSLVPWAGTSLSLISNIAEGKIPMFPDIDAFIVDVRDCAKMHITLMDSIGCNGNRHLCFAAKNKMIALSQTIQKYYLLKSPKAAKTMPKAMMYLASFFNEDAKTVYPKIGIDISYKTIYPGVFNYRHSNFDRILCDSIDSMNDLNILNLEKLNKKNPTEI